MIFLTSINGRVLVNGEEVEGIYTEPSNDFYTSDVVLKTKRGENYYMGFNLDEVRAKALIKFYHDKLEGRE